MIDDRHRGMPGRVLGLDFGLKRIGAALSDPGRIVATPLEVYGRRGRGLDLAHYRCLVDENEVVRIVVGLPCLADGSEGESAALARSWGRRLAEGLAVEVVYFDERYSTAEAERMLREQGVRAAKRRGLIDMLAAQVLLQAYLDGGSPDRPEPTAALEDVFERGES